MYGYPVVHQRQEVWNQVKNITDRLGDNENWMMIGDSNQVIYSGDKVSFKNNSLRGADAFKECLDYCGLTELPPKEQRMT